MSQEIITLTFHSCATEEVDKFIYQLGYETPGEGIKIYKEVNFEATRQPAIEYTIQILIALGSAGAFTGIGAAIKTFRGKNESKKLEIEKDGIKIILEGHSIEEELEILKKLKLK